MISIEDVKKLELIVARVIEVKDHPNADRLYVLKVDTGQDVRQLVAGIKSSYAKEDLTDKEIVMIANLQPAVIRGEESQGMLLAASDDEQIALVTPEKNVALGSQVR
jgi:methionyl-tRNA synthetase